MNTILEVCRIVHYQQHYRVLCSLRGLTSRKVDLKCQIFYLLAIKTIDYHTKMKSRDVWKYLTCYESWQTSVIQIYWLWAYVIHTHTYIYIYIYIYWNWSHKLWLTQLCHIWVTIYLKCENALVNEGKMSIHSWSFVFQTKFTYISLHTCHKHIVEEWINLRPM